MEMPVWLLFVVVGVLGVALAWTCWQCCRLAIELRPRKRDSVSREAIEAHLRRHQAADPEKRFFIHLRGR